MNIIKSHNDYKAKPQVDKAVNYFTANASKYDALLLEADICWILGKCVLSHQWTLNPFKWCGKLNDYVAKMNSRNCKFLQLEFKDPNTKCIAEAINMANRYPNIQFVWLYNSVDLTTAFKQRVEAIVVGGFLKNVTKLDSFEKLHKIDSVDLF